MSLNEKAKDVAQNVKNDAEDVKGDRVKDKVYSSTRQLIDEETARQEFLRSREKLFQVNDWSNIPGIGNANFTIVDRLGEVVDNRTVSVGDFLKIDLPGPLPMFWVEVIDLKDEGDLAEFIVKPAPDPTKSEEKEVIDHFFQEGARSIFRVERRGKELVGMEIGLNEAVNNKGDEAGNKAVINTVVSETGWAFFQKNQWENLTDYLVGKSE